MARGKCSHYTVLAPPRLLHLGTITYDKLPSTCDSSDPALGERHTIEDSIGSTGGGGFSHSKQWKNRRSGRQKKPWIQSPLKKKNWSVEGIPVPNRVLTEYSVDIKLNPFSGGYANTLTRKTMLCVVLECAWWPCLPHRVIAAFLAL